MCLCWRDCVTHSVTQGDLNRLIHTTVGGILRKRLTESQVSLVLFSRLNFQLIYPGFDSQCLQPTWNPPWARGLTTTSAQLLNRFTVTKRSKSSHLTRWFSIFICVAKPPSEITMKGCSPCTTGRGRPVGISRGRGGNSWRTCSGVGPHTSPQSGRPKPLAVVSEGPENPCPRPGWNSSAPFEAGAQDTVQQWQPQSRLSTAVVPLGVAAEQRWVHQELWSQACLLCSLNWFWSPCMILCWSPVIR